MWLSLFSIADSYSQKMWFQLLLVVSLVSSNHGQSSFLNYLMLVPAEVHYPSSETAYVLIIGAEEKMNVTITLQCSVQDNILFQQEVNPPEFYKSITFKTFPPEGGIEEVVSVHISLVGPKTRISESKYILVRRVDSSTLIQTDKPIYKPGETVKFQILRFDRHFLAVNKISPLVELQDPHKNRIGQWLNLTSQKGIIDLSHSLDSEAQHGVYTIIGPNARQFFHVSEYTLPTFEAVIKLPSVVSILDKDIPVKICGRYTFGKPIQGEINGKLCRKAVCYYWHYQRCPEDICTGYKGRTEKNGCLEVEIESEQYRFRSYDYQLSFEAEASLVEDGTGTRMNASSSCRISAMIAKVTFEEVEISDSYYKPGLKHKAKLKLVTADGSPMKSQTLHLTEKYGMVIKEHVYETDENGEAGLTLDTKPWNMNTVYLTATYLKNKEERIYGELNPYYIDAYKTLQPFSTNIKSVLKIQPLAEVLSCDRMYQIEIDYIIRGSELLNEEDRLHLHYVVVAKGDIVMIGHMIINISSDAVTTGTVELPLMVTADLAPMATILVLSLLGNGVIIADTEQFPVTKSFNNKVTLNFSKTEASPGSNVTLQVNAHPGSLCSIRAVDEGVLFMRPEAEISIEAVYRFLTQRNQYGYPYRVQEHETPCWIPGSSFLFNAHARRKRSYNWLTPSSPDVFTLIQDIGLKVITNTQVKKPQECLHFPPVGALSGFGTSFVGAHVSNVHSTVFVDKLNDELLQVTVPVVELTKWIRKSLPETWIWNMVTIPASGQIDIQVQLPDTITEWKTTAFCMGDVGLGIAPLTSIQGLQPYFIGMTLPYSVVRREAFTVTGTVYNYLSRPLMVIVHLEDTPELEIIDCPTCKSPQCVFPEQTKVFSWEAKALHTGSAKIVISTQAIHTEELCRGEQPIVPENGAIDSLMKSLIIKAEGMPVEKFYNSILCGRDYRSSENISIDLPPVVVPDSASAMFSVVGDTLGFVLEGIEKLLDRPIGCGEQTMVRLVPNILVLDYLQSVNKLTEEIQQQGLEYIMHGYQRELNYQREDGSFSTFGERDEEGNTGLSAYVMKSFSAASRHISVDKDCIQKIVNWLKNNQLPSGSFKNRGKLIKALQGGVDEEITLSAYVTLALLETEQVLENKMMQNEMMQRALQWLRSSVFQVDSLHTKAMLAYMFTLSGDYEIRAILLQDLHKTTVKQGGLTYWPENPNNPSKETLWSQPNSNKVEVASYMVLAHLSVDAPTTKDISEAFSLARWFIRQQTPNGGFENTQATVIGLQALCLLSKITYTRHGGLDVILSQEGEHSLHHFHVDEATRFLLQKRQLKDVPGVYNVQVKGDGCAFIQITLKYNTYPTNASPFFDLQINVTAEDSGNHSKSCLHYTIPVSYTGPRKLTNMVLLEVELPSGSRAISKSLTKLLTHNLVRRTETPDNKVVVYITELCKDVEVFEFSAEQDFTVQNQKSRSAKVYDYYESGEEAYMMYNLPNQ
ncbi:alpha-2-macroglobulin-like protein 1 isoform X2 [Mixophyes fleayi]|uniref:alpha-2-macroglobulin-like protein 1 isoform X2 n=1 Tax=Mixophyes fleayi TaxID=3061075 RepID=UPI003F4E27AB